MSWVRSVVGLHREPSPIAAVRPIWRAGRSEAQIGSLGTDEPTMDHDSVPRLFEWPVACRRSSGSPPCSTSA